MALFLEAEDSYRFFICYQKFSSQRNVLLDYLNSINSEILNMSENEVVQVLLFGNKSFSKDMNFRIINPQFVSLKAVTELSCVYSFMYIYLYFF